MVSDCLDDGVRQSPRAECPRSERFVSGSQDALLGDVGRHLRLARDDTSSRVVTRQAACEQEGAEIVQDSSEARVLADVAIRREGLGDRPGQNCVALFLLEYAGGEPAVECP